MEGRETTSWGSLLAVVAALWQSLAKALPCVKLFVFWLLCLALCLSTSFICLLATLRMAASCFGSDNPPSSALATPSDTPKHLLIPWQSAKCNSFSRRRRRRRSNGSAASALNELHKIHEDAQQLFHSQLLLVLHELKGFCPCKSCPAQYLSPNLHVAHNPRCRRRDASDCK